MTDIPAISGSSTGTWKSLVDAVISLINGKFNSRPYIWANAAARTAQTGMTIGEYGYQTDTQVTYRAISATTTEVWQSTWITWSTAPTNLAVGTGGSALQQQKYKYIGGRVFFDCKYVLGTSGASMGTAPVINLPVTLVRPSSRFFKLSAAVGMFDTSATAQADGLATLNALSAVQVLATYLVGATSTSITATAPWTWAAGDELAVQFWADVA